MASCGPYAQGAANRSLYSVHAASSDDGAGLSLTAHLGKRVDVPLALALVR